MLTEQQFEKFSEKLAVVCAAADVPPHFSGAEIAIKGYLENNLEKLKGARVVLDYYACIGKSVDLNKVSSLFESIEKDVINWEEIIHQFYQKVQEEYPDLGFTLGQFFDTPQARFGACIVMQVVS